MQGTRTNRTVGRRNWKLTTEGENTEYIKQQIANNKVLLPQEVLNSMVTYMRENKIQLRFEGKVNYEQANA